MINKLPLIEKGTCGQMDFDCRQHNSSHILLFIYVLVVVIFFLVLSARLFQLTIVKGAYYRNRSENNRIREVIIEAKRGSILDRKGYEIASSIDAPVDVSGDRLRSNRSYLDGGTLANLIGYRQQADKHDLDEDPCLNKLQLGDKVGKKGAEKLFECDLRGIAGTKLIEINASGKVINTIQVVPPQKGRNVQMAIDSDLQRKVYEIIKEKMPDKRVVAVATKPQTGEILLAISYPSFNSQDFEDGNTKAIVNYLQDPHKPLFNRVSEGVYPPGSTFKMVPAIGALEDKIIDESTQLNDEGFVKAGTTQFGNWYFLQYGKTEGEVDITKALRRSNDTFFYLLGEKMGPDRIKKWAEILGYHQKTDYGFEEVEGTIPSPFWKEDVLKDQWYTGDTYNMSIGQGYTLATPLQVNQVTSMLANKGASCKPKLLKVGTGSDLLSVSFAQPECKRLPISDKTIGIVRDGMRQACTTGGTGWPFFDFSVGDATSSASLSGALKRQIQVGCKTGTAESHGESGSPHAWFTVFAPYDNPEIALTVLVEEGGQGSDIAGPLAKEILNTYFERKE
ncbi:hypothetical protein HGB07_00525 [Candidatus Roizmanbacteria bacterium]|nr:hypothetical protein [Candidatus Roizmanbacteria bacterium]